MLSLAGNISYAALGFISFMILTRSLTKVEFGGYALFIAAASFLDRFRFGLTRTAVVRFLSGTKGEERRGILGANAAIGLLLVIAINIVLYAVLFIANNAIKSSVYYYFFLWYPPMAMANLFWNNAISHLQSYQGFGRILFLKTFNIGSFVTFLILNYFYWQLDVHYIILALIGANLIASLVSIVLNWDGLIYIFSANKKSINKIWNFGKFSVGTLVGSSLLRSADTFIIGLSPVLGAVGVAQYAIPLKLTQLIEIPLKSFMATAFPKLSKASMDKQKEKWKNIFNTYAGATTLLYIPFIIFLIVFAKWFILILGGDNYKDSLDMLTTIFRIFAVYGLLLPLDRINGVALDSINKPKLNLYKVILMASVNIIGDLIAVFSLESLVWVSIITVANSIAGIIIGYYYLNRKVKIYPTEILKEGINFYRNGLINFIKKA